MPSFGCPICGAANGTCTDGQPYRYPVEMEDLDIMANKATETVKARMPQQFVREGRGVAGYRGNVEVYDPRAEEKKKKAATKARAPKEDK